MGQHNLQEFRDGLKAKHSELISCYFVKSFTNRGKAVMVQMVSFGFNKACTSCRRNFMFASTVLKSAIVPPYGCPGVPSII